MTTPILDAEYEKPNPDEYDELLLSLLFGENVALSSTEAGHNVISSRPQGKSSDSQAKFDNLCIKVENTFDTFNLQDQESDMEAQERQRRFEVISTTSSDQIQGGPELNNEQVEDSSAPPDES